VLEYVSEAGTREAMSRTTPEQRWHPPAEALVLGSDEVHVWRAALEVPATQMQAYARLLASDERARAAKFRFERDRSHFVVARGILRSLLSRYLHNESHPLHFTYNQFGKPTLAGEADSQNLLFNVAHSHKLALYAVTRLGAIGIDLEYMRDDPEYERIAERFFSPNEVYLLHTVPQEKRLEAFFACWTRKEAYIKARGMGLSLDLKDFDVSLAPGEPITLLNSREEGLDITRWSLYDLSPGAGYKAALAVEGHPVRLMCWQWS